MQMASLVFSTKYLMKKYTNFVQTLLENIGVGTCPNLFYEACLVLTKTWYIKKKPRKSESIISFEHSNTNSLTVARRNKQNIERIIMS